MIKYYKCIALLGAFGVANTVHANTDMDGCPQNIRIADLKNIIETAEPAPEISPDHFKVRWKDIDWILGTSVTVSLKKEMKNDKFLLGNRLSYSTIKNIFKDGIKNEDGIKREILVCQYTIFKYTYGRMEQESGAGTLVMTTEFQPAIKTSTPAHIWK